MIYSIDDGKLVPPGVRVGEGPDALAFSASGRLLLVVNAQSGDIAAVRLGPTPLPCSPYSLPGARRMTSW